MISKYLVSVQNDYNEMMVFQFKEIHDALTMYRVCKHDETVTIVSVTSVECDDNDNESFTDSDCIRYYERGVDNVCN